MILTFRMPMDAIIDLGILCGIIVPDEQLVVESSTSVSSIQQRDSHFVSEQGLDERSL